MALNMMISAPILAVGGVIMAYRQDGPLTLILVVIIPIMALLIYAVMSRAIPLFQAMQVKIDRINLVMRETLSGVRVIRAFVRTKHEEQRFDVASRDLMDTGLRVNRLFAITLPALMVIMNLSSVAVIWLGAYRVDCGRHADRQPDGVPAVHHADPVRDHDRGDHVRAWSRGRPSRPAGSARCSTPSPPSPTRRRRSPRSAAARSSSRDVTFGYPGAEAAGPAQRLVPRPTRRDDGHRRLHGQRQDARSSTSCRASTT